MLASSKFPSVTIITPTLNSGNYLPKCLQSIRSQNYPQTKIIIRIIDGGSSDNTLKIAQKYNCKIIKNPLKTAEAGKAIGLKKLTTPYVCLIDSDNILPHKNWLKTMIKPLLANPQIIGSEPISFTYRQNAGFIERYSALLGANDPYAYVSGLYDRFSHLSGTWTGLNIPTKKHPGFLLLTIDPQKPLPTIGANGTLYQSSLFQNFTDNYLFDIDFLHYQKNQLLFAKTNIGIIHTYCESSISKFIKKQRRRIVDFYIYSSRRRHSWASVANSSLKFSLYTCLFFPALFDSIKGFIKKPDLAWFFHPLACLITFYLYSNTTLKHRLNLLKPINRQNWSK